eukprot:Skav234470  [mRNA]  locus=scaffold1647:271055:271452:+ [translate_table: standard]
MLGHLSSFMAYQKLRKAEGANRGGCVNLRVAWSPVVKMYRGSPAPNRQNRSSAYSTALFQHCGVEDFEPVKVPMES